MCVENLLLIFQADFNLESEVMENLFSSWYITMQLL